VTISEKLHQVGGLGEPLKGEAVVDVRQAVARGDRLGDCRGAVCYSPVSITVVIFRN
jgi:hypothetical protein